MSVRWWHREKLQVRQLHLFLQVHIFWWIFYHWCITEFHLRLQQQNYCHLHLLFLLVSPKGIKVKHQLLYFEYIWNGQVFRSNLSPVWRIFRELLWSSYLWFLTNPHLKNFYRFLNWIEGHPLSGYRWLQMFLSYLWLKLLKQGITHFVRVQKLDWLLHHLQYHWKMSISLIFSLC